MSPDKEIDPHESPRALFAFELRRHREAAHMSQRQLAERLGYSDSMINLVERAKRPPSRQFAELCDRTFALDGTMLRLYMATTWHKAPEYLRPWLEEEEYATGLRNWEPLIIPGLLQTRAYAREILATWPGVTDEELEERVTNRMQRQARLYQDKPPDLNFLIDEDVITHPIGGAGIMREQLGYLLEMAEHPQVTIQVVPYAARPHCGLMGGFIIAERNGSSYAAYSDAQPVGRTFDDRALITDLIRKYDAIRAEAVPFKESLRLIEEAVNRIGS
ncbi:helix-turn-helix domain-containing protein [Sphaerisporangium krabiense]|uniref:Transcriptional regulator with XRE-family HTH domain n=1 Tax=Sphaerisporangium krabiense TaxID=763782 RepID=A0A7W8YYV5_9ACTN|nr:helix-turn-helix transcriptional regulator [Sphaerisporangium krabiense]MBB5624349.1 transcriptional regulator with XRE-family HTH domain [Sphaerisporangium krabiense]